MTDVPSTSIGSQVEVSINFACEKRRECQSSLLLSLDGGDEVRTCGIAVAGVEAGFDNGALRMPKGAIAEEIADGRCISGTRGGLVSIHSKEFR